MGLLFQNWQGSFKLLIIHLICWLGWLSIISVAQPELGGTLTGSLSLPDFGITCVGNLSYFITCFLRRRLQLDISVSEFVLKTNRGPIRMIDAFVSTTCIGEYGLHCASVVMLSKGYNRNRGSFMRYIYNAHGLHSILLQHLPLKRAAVTAEICACNECQCHCIVFWTVEEITTMLALRMPRTLKRLSDSLCLLPSLKCLTNGCHGCNQGLLHVETDEFGMKRLAEGDSITVTGESPAAVCQALDVFQEFSNRDINHMRNCICIPVHPAVKDDWTNFLIQFFKCKNKEVGLASASDHLQNYMAHGGICSIFEKYARNSLCFEIFLYLGLTFGLKMDGFSSSVLAGNAIRNYKVNSKETGYSANMFVEEALVMSNADNTHVCQLLSFNVSNPLSDGSFFFVLNMIWFIGWAVLVAHEGGTCKWYGIPSMAPSKARVSLIMAAIVIALVMDSVDLFFLSKNISGTQSVGRRISAKRKFNLIIIVLEMTCIVSGIAIARTSGIKGFGRWIYSVLHALVWLKWGIGIYILDQYLFKDDTNPVDSQNCNRGLQNGILVYSSAFLLNAVLAAAMTKWKND